MEKERLLKAAAAYVGMGWSVFTVTGSKRPWRNCGDCPAGAHDGAMCSCLRCHGHLAATRDLSRVEDMLALPGDSLLGVAGGAGSGDLVVLDGEGHDAVEHGRTGVEVLDLIEQYVPGACLEDTLRARSVNGGVHLFYRLAGVGAHNRALPSVDVKGNGGYVVVPPQEGGARTWLNWGQEPTSLVPESPLGTWLLGLGQRRGGLGRGHGRVLASRLVDGLVPAGERYEFTRDLVYKLRKQGVSWEEAVSVARSWWDRYEQPANAARCAGGVWYLPWRQVEYELERAWVRVEPEPPLAAQMLAWMEKNR